MKKKTKTTPKTGSKPKPRPKPKSKAKSKSKPKRKKVIEQKGFSKKDIVIDAKSHLVGRLAAYVAKLLLQGETITVLRCESMFYSGTFARHRIKYLNFLHKRCNVNPKRGPFHHRAPSKIFQRSVRGMLPIKIKRGKEAYRRLKVYEGVPNKFTKCKKMIVPEAVMSLRLRPGSPYCSLGRLSHLLGWKYQHVVATLEAKRKLKQKHYVDRLKRSKVRIRKLHQYATKNVEEKKRLDRALRKYGY